MTYTVAEYLKGQANVCLNLPSQDWHIVESSPEWLALIELIDDLALKRNK